MPVFGVYDVQAGFVAETAGSASFGAIPSNPFWLWIGEVQNLDPTMSRNMLQIWSFDQNRDPVAQPYMEKTFDYKIKWYPQNSGVISPTAGQLAAAGAYDIYLLTAVAQSVNTTWDFEEFWKPQAGVIADQRYYRYLGAKASKARISWKVGQPIEVDMDFMFREVYTPFPDTITLPGATYQAEFQGLPYLFSDATINFDPLTSVGQTGNFSTAGVSGKITCLDFEININNRIDRQSGFTIGDSKVASLPIGRREIDFSMTRLFEDQFQVDQFINGINGANTQGTIFRVQLPIGPGHSITINNAKWNPLTVPKDIKRDVLVFRFTGKAQQPIAGGSALTVV